MTTQTYAICVAYEQGVGWGLSGRDKRNPYAADDPGHEAWGHGWDYGMRRKMRADSGPTCWACAG